MNETAVRAEDTQGDGKKDLGPSTRMSTGSNSDPVGCPGRRVASKGSIAAGRRETETVPDAKGKRDL